MRFFLVGPVILAALLPLWTTFKSAAAFVPAQINRERRLPTITTIQSSISGEEIYNRLQEQLAKLRDRDRRSKLIKPEVSQLKMVEFIWDNHHKTKIPNLFLPSLQDLKIVYEDNHLIVVDKPPGILCVPSEEGIPSLAQTVYEKCRKEKSLKVNSMDQMVVHRLGMETSGLVVFTKTMDSLRGMNTLFRTRSVTRQYEALVCGHVQKVDATTNREEFGWITLPLMRDFECPPFMRISTDQLQEVLIGLDPDVVGKRLLEAPKASLTKYEIVSRENLSAPGSDAKFPVTRLTLTAITGRTHQLNVHLAAFGHPIVGDKIYGFDGDALPNGGLDVAIREKNNPTRASEDLQEQIAAVAEAKGMNMCAHAKYLSFRHPITTEDISFSSSAPF